MGVTVRQKVKDKGKPRLEETMALSVLSQLLDQAVWHEYLENRYVIDKVHKRLRDNFVELLEQCREVLEKVIPAKEARQIMRAKYTPEKGRKIQVPVIEKTEPRTIKENRKKMERKRS